MRYAKLLPQDCVIYMQDACDALASNEEERSGTVEVCVLH